MATADGDIGERARGSSPTSPEPLTERYPDGLQSTPLVLRRRQTSAVQAELVALGHRLAGRKYDREGATTEASDPALGERHYSQ